MSQEREYQKDEIAKKLKPIRDEAQKRIEELGLEPRDVKYWINHNDEVNQLAAYGGFQERYPHWRWGMKYDRQQKQDEYGGGKIFEMVINSNPCHAYLQMSNDDVDQKTVIVHVEAHSDFFANNEWFQDNPRAVDMLSRHARRIEEYMEDPDIEREEVEKWIDNILCLEDNIDQYSDYIFRQNIGVDDYSSPSNESKKDISHLNLDNKVEDAVFDDDFYEVDEEASDMLDNTTEDILGFLINEGKQNKKPSETELRRAVDYEEWQIDILDMLREEAYYFAPQKMTKVMNEGWASYVESLIMTDEEFATGEEIIDYADHHSKVLASPGFNPYKLGKELWKHINNTVDRREVVDKLLRIEGITADNFHREINFQEVYDELKSYNSDDIIERNYSLTKPENQGFIQSISLDNLRKISRYIIEQNRYDDIESAVGDVDYHKGWDRMKEIRETHNDVMFIDEFLTQEFVDDQNYFTYEYRVANSQQEIASKDVEDVRKKLLFELTNFGKPKIKVVSGNYNNSGELLLLHDYNGVVLDYDKLEETMKRLWVMWGRPINIATVGKMIDDKDLDYAYSEG